jgi:hypothetical protein
VRPRRGGGLLRGSTADEDLEVHLPSAKIALSELSGHPSFTKCIRHGRVPCFDRGSEPPVRPELQAAVRVVPYVPLLDPLAWIVERRDLSEKITPDAGADVRPDRPGRGGPVANRDQNGLNGDGVRNAQRERLALENENALPGFLEPLDGRSAKQFAKQCSYESTRGFWSKHHKIRTQYDS